jgi:hypothetical protein
LSRAAVVHIEERAEIMNLFTKVSLACAVGAVMIFAAAPRPADAAGASGRWSISGHSASGSSVTPVCVITQSGGRISGTCRGPNASGPVAGTVNGATIAFSWRTMATTGVGYTGVVSFRGVLGRDGVVRGTYAPGGGAFVMQRS